MQPLTLLPNDIINDFGAEVFSATPTEKGVYRLVDARRTAGSGYQGQRITVLVLDENGVAMPGVPIAFSYSTADHYTLTSDFAWIPPQPYKAFIVRTGGSGEIDMIQGDVIRQGGSGGMTVYILDPAHSSDLVTGAGMLADHTGLYLTYQLRRTGVIPLSDALAELKTFILDHEGRITALEGKPAEDVGLEPGES